MPLGRQMADVIDVGRPLDAGWILRTGDHEAMAGRAPRRLDEQPLQGRLAVVAGGPEKPELVAVRGSDGSVKLRIGTAVEGTRARAAILLLDDLESRPASEREV